ncbi:unnamed protein product, partial [Allacma fusca]
DEVFIWMEKCVQLVTRIHYFKCYMEGICTPITAEYLKTKYYNSVLYAKRGNVFNRLYNANSMAFLEIELWPGEDGQNEGVSHYRFHWQRFKQTYFIKDVKGEKEAKWYIDKLLGKRCVYFLLDKRTLALVKCLTRTSKRFFLFPQLLEGASDYLNNREDLTHIDESFIWARKRIDFDKYFADLWSYFQEKLYNPSYLTNLAKHVKKNEKYLPFIINPKFNMYDPCVSEFEQSSSSRESCLDSEKDNYGGYNRKTITHHSQGYLIQQINERKWFYERESSEMYSE